jgi:hypothetical protein
VGAGESAFAKHWAGEEIAVFATRSDKTEPAVATFGLIVDALAHFCPVSQV